MCPVRERNTQIFGLPTRISAGQMGIAEQARGAVAEHRIRDLLIPVGCFADRKISTTTLLAFAADDRERDYNAIADFERVLRRGSDLNHLAHGLVAHDIARLHAWHEMIVQMQVRSADRATRDFDNGVPLVLDFRVGDAFAPDVGGAAPDKRLHGGSFACKAPASRTMPAAVRS